MRCNCVAAARSWLAPALAVAAALLWLSAGASRSSAQETTLQIVGVEEDWELVVSQADQERGAPQVTTVLSPLGHLNGLYVAYELNHQSQPSYVCGGMQLQIWNGEQPVARQKHKEGQLLTQASEVIRWTHKMYVNNGTLTFDIDDGTSTSWGAFGNGLYTGVTTSLANLNGYNPNVSVQGSGPGYAANRVTSLVLKRVRVRTSDGQVVEDSTPKIAYPKQ